MLKHKVAVSACQWHEVAVPAVASCSRMQQALFGHNGALREQLWNAVCRAGCFGYDDDTCQFLGKIRVRGLFLFDVSCCGRGSEAASFTGGSAVFY
jgi:hypothetical protein